MEILKPRYVAPPEKKKSLLYYLLRPSKFLQKLKEVYKGIYLKYLGYYWRKILNSPKKFTFNKKTYPYFVHQFNQTYYNERCVEIPIVIDEFKKHDPADILEVGNVLSHYFNYHHTIIDKFEKSKGVINVDIIDYKPSKKYNLITSISTLEHVGWDDLPKDDNKIPVAVNALKNLLTDDGTLLVTAPLGYNPNLDGMLQSENLGFSKQLFLKRTGSNGVWKEVTLSEAKNAKYGSPYPCANVLFVGIYQNNLN